ncbi:Seipin-like protein [Erysiphe neolycopersici]|uniref:Seipin-like protein n=1 Tax=Erysiphe neolycopersici TaxID=212602 RepID=A0A420I3Q5_9PEZI|nr:Seipin-like protein [Erysiphe neolycopersici]
MEFVTKLLQLAASKPARQTLIYTFLITAATSILLGIAVFAYILFYCNFIPQIEIRKVIHLQYGDGPHPYGIIQLGSELVSRQAYDIFISLNLPRSPQNLARGNFMTTLALLSPLHKFNVSHFQKFGISDMISPMSIIRAEDVIFAFRRPAIMTYASLLVSLTSRILTLPLYTLSFLSEAENLMISIGEDVSFTRGWKNIPSLALLEIQAGQEIQIYDAAIIFKAKFSGLRWLMYNHRVASFILFTGLFWVSTLVFAIIAWATLSMYFVPENESTKNKSDDILDDLSIKVDEMITDDDLEIKTEDMTTDDEPDLSDTSHIFPTYGRQLSLRYSHKAKDICDEIEHSKIDPFIKEEDEDKDQPENINPNNLLKIDSGIGTGLSESGKILAKKRIVTQRK